MSFYLGIEILVKDFFLIIEYVLLCFYILLY